MAKKKEQPPFQVYEGSKVAISKAVGPLWKSRLETALFAYDKIYSSWEEVYRYYNNHQSQDGSLETSRGVFRRGDSTDNVIFSNINLLLPAVYSKNPEITCSSVAKEDEEFSRDLGVILTTFLTKKNLLNAKPKVKRAAGLGLMTNNGVLKLDFVQKTEGIEVAAREIARLTDELSKAKTQAEVDKLYGQMQALEAQIEVSERSGPKLGCIMPHDLIIDPNAKDNDGCDGNWMIERVMLPTEFLKSRYMITDGEGAPLLVYKPTHKASVAQDAEYDREDGVGLVYEAMDMGDNVPTSHTDDERLMYQQMHMTECYYVWDKVYRRVMLFMKSDWSWPLWVWDDPLELTRFFPYFLINYSFSLSGGTCVGETSYYLDQQDDLNDINRQVGRIRRTVFNYFFYNSRKIKPDAISALVKALRGEATNSQDAIGVQLEEGEKISDVFEAVLPPSADYEALFNKEPILQTINRISNISDALRGVQFKTNTNEKAVETYQESAKLSTGSKIDVVEDVLADIASSLAELLVYNYEREEISEIVGQAYADTWQKMHPKLFATKYNIAIVAGSTEKPTSVFKKKEAVEVAQAVGQFAQAAPGSALKMVVRMLSNAFTEFTVKPEDWDSMDQEIQATMQKGISTGGAQPNGGAAPAAEGGQQPPNGGNNPQVEALLQAAPPEVKQMAAQMAQQGATPEQIIQTLQQGATQNAA